jgi:site-specific recombinase XerD
MPPVPNSYRAVYIRPRNDFENFAAAEKLAATEICPQISPRLFNLPLVAVIVNAEGAPIWMPTLFLADTALGSRTLTGDTVRTYAEALLPWLAYLDSYNLSVNDVTEETIGIYRANLSHAVKGDSDVPYASATVNQRVVVPAIFHEWGQRRGAMPSPLGKYLCTADPEIAWHLFRGRRIYRTSRLPRIATPRIIKRLPISLSEEQIRCLFAVAPMPYRLMLKWSVVCGLRRFEICDLRISDLPKPEQIDNSSDRMLPIRMKRKGGREVDIYTPSTLIEETNWFVLTQRGVPAPGCESAVFLNSRGGRISRQIFSRVFQRCAVEIGVRANLHHLRHTFACHVLRFLEKRVDKGEQINSLKTLQVLLGHANIETTEVYLMAYEISGGDVIAALDFLYGASI